MKLSFLLALLITLRPLHAADTNALSSKPRESGTLWSHINYRAVALPQSLLLCVSRQPDGFSLSLFASEHFLRHEKFAVRLLYPDGQVVLPSSTIAHSLVLAGSFGGSWSSQVEFSFGKNLWQEAWLELSAGHRRLWLEIPYGFTRDPTAPPPPPSTNGFARYAAPMSKIIHDTKSLQIREIEPHVPSAAVPATNQNIILHWSDIEYDSFPIQNGWRATFRKWNQPEDAPCEVELYREDDRGWDLYSPRTSLRIVSDGLDVQTTCMGIRRFPDRMRRTDSFSLSASFGVDDLKRSWGNIVIAVDGENYSLAVPSSIYYYYHGTASFDAQAW